MTTATTVLGAGLQTPMLGAGLQSPPGARPKVSQGPEALMLRVLDLAPNGAEQESPGQRPGGAGNAAQGEGGMDVLPQNTESLPDA
jgi:hypothetical protein